MGKPFKYLLFKNIDWGVRRGGNLSRMMQNIGALIGVLAIG